MRNPVEAGTFPLVTAVALVTRAGDTASSVHPPRESDAIRRVVVEVDAVFELGAREIRVQL